MEDDNLDNLDEPIWGVKTFAQVIKRTERQVFHMIYAGQLPVNQVGGRYVSTRRKLLNAVLGDMV